MTVATHSRARQTRVRPVCLVWIDSRRAVVVRWHDDQAIVEHLESDVPAHRHSTGDMGPDAALETQRLEHLARFVGEVAQRLPADDDVLLLGPGTVRHQLERHLRTADHGREHPRSIDSGASRPLTEPQLIARLRNAIGAQPPRRAITSRTRPRTPPPPPRQKHVPISALEPTELEIDQEAERNEP